MENLKIFLEKYFNEVIEYDDWCNINNPFVPDNKFHMGINKNNLWVNCFKTGYKAPLEQFLSEYLGISKIAIKNQINRYLNSNIDIQDIKPKNKIKLPSSYLPLTIKSKYKPYKSAINYLLSRGLNNYHIKKYQLGYCIDGEYKDYIIIPFIKNNQLDYFLGRGIGNKLPKYKDPKGVDKKDKLFRYDELKDEIAIVEGVFDAMTLKMPTTCILTNILSIEKAKEITSLNLKKIIFIPDNDEAGINKLFKNIDILKKTIPIGKNISIYYYLINKKYKDLNEGMIEEIDLSKIIKDSIFNRWRIKNI